MLAGVISFLSGLVFAVGLALSGMTQPAKIIGFLDFTGSWDPSLALVMGGALGVFAVAWRLSRRWAAPVFAASFPRLDRTAIDTRLVAGAAVFGIGWGLGGFCPGPALVSAGAGAGAALVFVPAMAAGIFAHRSVDPAGRR